jgi:UDP-N-acetylmuramoyl-tripeptide--D-alanyl-D-alanine ligase
VDVRDRGIDGTVATVVTPKGKTEIITPLPGLANLANVLAATAVAQHFDVPLTDIAAKAVALRPVAHRGEVIRAAGITIVDDSYNSNPKAIARALAMIHGEHRYARRIAVIGEMLELGEASSTLHAAAGRDAAGAGLSALIAVGGAPAKALAEAAVDAGMPAGRVHYVEDSTRAAELAASIVEAGDLVLVKGSRGVRTEVVVERLTAGRG